MAITQESRIAAIGTPLGVDVLVLRSMQGSEQLGRLFQYDVELLSEDFNINFDDIIGQNVTIRLEVNDNKTRYFNGFVSKFVQAASNSNYARYQASIVPWLWFLTKTADCRIFQDMDVPEILEAVFKRHGFDAYELRLSSTYRKWEYCVQYRETDFNFVSRLMEQEGIYYYFKHEDGKHTLVLIDSPAKHEDYPGYEEITYRPPDDTGTVEHIREWVINRELQSGAYAHRDFNFTTPKTDLRGEASVPRSHAAADFEIYDYPGEYDKPSEGEAYAKIRIQEIQARFETLQGQGDVRGVCAGYTFTLKDYPREDQNRRYLVESVSHSIYQDAYESGRGGGGNTYRCSLSVSAADEQFRPTRITAKPVVQGPQTAIVVGPKGEEIYTDKYGRVKVLFHWDRYAKADENSSCWIRVAQVWAGKNWGAIYTPRIGQEVIVEFLEGDPDRPIITGRVYNDDAMPPYGLPDDKTKSTIKSLSSKGGGGFNEIRFEDKKDKEQIFVHGQRNLDIRVRNDVYETNYGNREVRVGWEKDGQTGGSLNTLVRLDTNSHVKGGQFELIEKNLNQTVKEDVVEDYQKDQTTMVGTKLTINAKEIIVEAKDTISEKSAKVLLQGSDAIHIKGGSVNIEGSQGISLKVGSNFVTVGPSGVDIKGSMVNINSGGSGASADEAVAAVEGQIKEPIDALPADTGKPQKNTGVSATPRTQKSRTLKPQKAPPWKPPAPTGGVPVVAPPVVGPPPAQSDKPCGLKSFELVCQHKKFKRAPGPSRVIHVVPDASNSSSVSRKFGWSEAGFEFTISGSHKYGGEEKLKLRVSKQDESVIGPKKSALVRQQGVPRDSDWKDNSSEREVALLSPSDDRFWNANTKPEKYFAYARCCDEVMQDYEILVFPSDQYEVGVSLEAFKKLAERISNWLKQYVCKSWGDVRVGIEVSPPGGELKVTWGWQEMDDWQACWRGEVGASVKLFGLTAFGKWNLRDTALRLGLTAMGVPPIISNAIIKLKNEYREEREKEGLEPADVFDYLLQIMVELTVNGTPQLKGTLTKKLPATGDALPVQGSVQVVGSLVVTLKAYAQVGQEDWWLYVKVEGIGETGLDFVLDLELERDGLWGKPKITWPGISVRVSAAFHVAEKKAERKEEGKAEGGKEIWKLEGGDVWPSEDEPNPPKWLLVGERKQEGSTG